MKLLPQPHDFSSPTQKPKLRDVAPKNLEVLTFGLVWDFQAAIVNRAVAMASDDESRIIKLVKSFGAFRPESRSAVLTHVDDYLAAHKSAEGSQVWYELKAEVGRHEFFADTDWALREDERRVIDAILNRHSPSDPLAMDRQVFESWIPRIGRYKPGVTELEDMDKLRKEVLERILAREGPAGIFRLACTVKQPNLIGPVLRLISITQDQLFDLLDMVLAPTTPRELAFYVSAVGAERYGEAWKVAFKERELYNFLDDADKAHLLLGWPLNESTWSFARSLGKRVNDEYWQQTQALPIHGSLEQLLFSIEQLRQRARSLDVIVLLHLRLKDISTELILSLLSEGQKKIVDGLKKMGNMLPYYISLTFTELRKRIDVQEFDIARQEYAYLPVLSESEQPLTIFNLLSKKPEFFIDVLSHVFRGKNTPQDTDLTEEEMTRAHVSYNLISSFKTVPGFNGDHIDLEALSTWTAGAREAAKNKELIEISDQYIGHLFAHAPIDPEESFWPPSPVCKVIESVASEDIETGIRIECFNKRGVSRRAINAGGDQERELSTMYEVWADRTVQFPRTSAMLKNIAEMWNEHANEQDIQAEKSKLKI
jgi:hypothetical protein